MDNIQYAAEGNFGGIDTLIFVTVVTSTIEDHFDANNELEALLRSKGKNIKLT